MGITTDSKGEKDPKDPDSCIVFQVHKLFLSEDETKKLADEYKEGISYGDAKARLFEAYMDFFSSMRARHSELKEKELQEIMDDGARKAKALAGEKMEKVRKAVGLQ